MYLEKGFFNRFGERLPSVRFLERLLRLKSRGATVIDDEHFLIARVGHVYLLNVLEKSFKIEHRFRKGTKTHLSFCARRDKNGHIEKVLYGEYFGNPDREAVAIYERETGGVEESI
ncbi:MAG: hypothetical protein NC331_00585 [Lachnospiraceae bacterium]|nr:hypothetical protein [Lachnospiraceae bacterium]